MMEFSAISGFRLHPLLDVFNFIGLYNRRADGFNRGVPPQVVIENLVNITHSSLPNRFENLISV